MNKQLIKIILFDIKSNLLSCLLLTFQMIVAFFVIGNLCSITAYKTVTVNALDGFDFPKNCYSPSSTDIYTDGGIAVDYDDIEKERNLSYYIAENYKTEGRSEFGLLILMNSGVFTWSWINSKRSEIMARRICGADDADIKKMIFINFLMISAVGILIGFIVTLLLTLIPAVSYYLGNIRISAGLISVAFILLIGGIISYSLSDKYSHEQVISLRRVL